ncbi:hypothetical protein [Streptosporangium roseum]|uniref:hypothetical protein n=1 Tax=Streptosporangium roseum TaxID=2001 RepID=UPI00332EFF3F
MRFGAVPVGESGTTAGERDGSRYAREGTPLPAAPAAGRFRVTGRLPDAAPVAARPGEAVVVNVRGIDAPRTSLGEL